jgi:hypothetical protein
MSREEYVAICLRQSPAERKRDSRAAKRLGLSVAAYRQQQAVAATPSACHKSEPAATQAAPTCDIAKTTAGRPLPQFVRPSKNVSSRTSLKKECVDAPPPVASQAGELMMALPTSITMPVAMPIGDGFRLSPSIFGVPAFMINIPADGPAVGMGRAR